MAARQGHGIRLPAHPREFLEAERASMGDLFFRSEYLCEFVDTSDTVFSYDSIMAAISPEITPLWS